MRMRRVSLVRSAEIVFDGASDTGWTGADGRSIRAGKIFQIGQWPDKQNFSLSRREMERAVQSFKPCDLDVEHADTVFKGKMGRLEAIQIGRDGKTLFGIVSMPPWLAGLLTDAEFKVSCAWESTRKTLEGLDIVRDPRISDAALTAAFSASQQRKGSAMATFAEKLKEKLQDLVDSLDESEDDQSGSGASNNKNRRGGEQGAQGARFSRAGGASGRDRRRQQDDDDEADDAPESGVAVFSATDLRIFHLEAENEVRKAIADHRLWPREFDEALIDFEQALQDDARHPVVFSLGKDEKGVEQKGGRAARQRAQWYARSQYSVTSEKVEPRVLDNSTIDFSGDELQKEVQRIAADALQAELANRGITTTGNVQT